MIDAARFAAMSDPDRNFHFRRAWAEPPPQNRKRRSMGGSIGPAEDFVDVSGNQQDSVSERRAQRASALDKAADHELSLGHLSVAERLARMADSLREDIERVSE